MNIYYMNTNITQSDFPIVVWNDLIPRSVGAVWCPAGEYEHHTGRWGEPEKGGVGADAGLRSVNSTDDTRTDSFPKENK
jgi:hypothetical protein